MVTRAHTVAFLGVEAKPVEVQCALAPGLPAFNVVGLADKAVSESRERVRASMGAIGLAMPAQRITVNLSPADLPKAGSHYDLPIALALMAALGLIPAEEVDGHVALGELSLDGEIRAVQGALPAALAAAAQNKGLICPEACGSEAAWVGATEVLAPAGLIDLVNHFAGRKVLAPPEPGAVARRRSGADLVDVKGQEGARRALEVAAAGGHHVLLIGEPGSGKSMLASRLTSIMPPLSPEEALEVSVIYSLAAQPGDGTIFRERPYRAPHHSASPAAMIGGGRDARPGEVSLAHRGVLFLDELPEFARPVLETLRQPIETGEVVVARATAHVRYPARFLLVAAMNPCRCGYLGDASRACSKAPRCGADYTARISGPLIDRFDIRIEVPAVTPDVLALPPHGETSARIARRVAEARGVQAGRMNGAKLINGELEGEILDRVATPDAPGQTLLRAAAEKLRMSARGYHRILRLARTLADLEGSDAVRKVHVAEAVGYRRALG
ncbi:MAG TPA: YifB family Mg chelatase-like AAA ATPase [Thermohalobaculum sp.]|nr:YifB family Mg chelatase-like AAA ATPase [Thermohalobaculum sp.]